MGEVVPITPELQPYVDRIRRKQDALQQQRHNLLWHGLPVCASLLAIAGIVFSAGLKSQESDPPVVERCGIGIAEPNGGAYSVLDRAINDAQLAGNAQGYHDAARRIDAIDPDIHTGERFKILFEGGRIALDSIQQVNTPVNSCAELDAIQMNLTSTAAVQ